MLIQLRSQKRCFDGDLCFMTHDSALCQGPMNFTIFLPSKSEKERCPVVYFLSGLTCSDENFMAKAGAQRWAEELGLIIVAPDTSPRGRDLPGVRDDWTFGEGASFYVNATESPWSSCFRMFDYIAFELPAIVDEHFNTLPDRRSIMGHSMGGHGAMVIGLRQPARFSAISAISPICAPSKCTWGQNAFSKFFGANESAWAAHDTCSLIRNGIEPKLVRIDQGSADEFLNCQLMTHELIRVANEKKFPIEVHTHHGYDHSYYFVATVIETHLRYHACALVSDPS